MFINRNNSLNIKLDDLELAYLKNAAKSAEMSPEGLLRQALKIYCLYESYLLDGDKIEVTTKDGRRFPFGMLEYTGGCAGE